MTTRKLMTRILMAGLALYTLAGIARAGTDLAGEFVTPPDTAMPWVNMWWFDEITPADITQHMEELKAKGVGGVMLIDTSSMPGAPYMSDKWRVLFRHAVREADRLGLKMGVNVCVGWPSGGPWITPENSSWTVLSSRTVIKGPQRFSAKLVEPNGKGALYADVAVHAYPIPDETSARGPQIAVGGNPGELSNLLSGNFNTPWNSGADPWIKVDFGGPHLVDWIWIDGGNRIVIEASADGVAFTPVATWDAQPRSESVYRSVPATTARWFRVGVSGGVRGFALGVRAEVDRVVRLAAKRAITHPSNVTGARLADQVSLVREDLVALPSDRPLRMQDAIDLTAKVTAEGTLNWDVPPGKWNVVRIGRTTTGMSVGGGLLPDYLSPQASEQNYSKGMKPLVGDAGALVGKTLQYFIEDNVEIDRVYCWTPRLLEEFQQRRGYQPAPYLAAMAGEIVENVEITDRFLADVRRTIADCVADGHYGRWAELAHADGIKVRAEAGGQHHPRLLCNDGLMNQGRVDVPVAEFWVNEWWKENQWVPANHHVITTPGWDEAAQNVNAKQAASAGHLYGKPLVASESFTTAMRRTNWGAAPADLLRYANIAFCEGINTLSIHGSATSGPAAGKPGKMFPAGTHFNHNVTWWNQGAAPFLLYLTRCSHLLRQGHFVADVLYYSGDEAPNFVPPKTIDPARGFGYDYDVCNTEILLTRLSVKDGRMVLPDEMSYRVLVLPDQKTMPLEVLGKIKTMVEAGATVVGPRPERTPGLKDYPKCDEQLRQMAEQLWGDEDNKVVMQREVGKGRIIRGKAVRDILQADGIGPDFSFHTEEKIQPLSNGAAWAPVSVVGGYGCAPWGTPGSFKAPPFLDFIHRSVDGTEIYFVANRRASALHADCTFRVSGKQPELWDQVTGVQRDLPQFESKDGCTSVPLEFEPYGAMFVVFRKNVQQRDDTTQHRGEVNFPGLSQTQELTGQWTIQFDPQWFYPTNGLTAEQAKGLMVFDKLEDWTKRAEPAVRNFSGTAVYKKVFSMPAPVAGQRCYLDLGTVKDLAKVRLNGKDLAVVWCSPWRVEITAAAKPGDNALEIEMVNLWPNRLIGDSTLPATERRTRTGFNIDIVDTSQPVAALVGWISKDPLSSGLLGPVTIQTTLP
ncbi:MAG: glycosyl hydrolase [Verrucomicrobia bacterium]|nr:glycosyl hydrolase [Verrucomicrobiota bacterium]